MKLTYNQASFLGGLPAADLRAITLSLEIPVRDKRKGNDCYNAIYAWAIENEGAYEKIYRAWIGFKEQK